MASDPEGPVRLGVSACLLGEPVRFDGGHKRNDFLVGALGPFVEWVPVCPEVESGMTTPRETLHLAAAHGGVRLITTKTGVDQTASMRRYSARRVGELAGEDLCGYVLKKDSPSCGLERVRVYGAGGVPSRSGRGVFAEALVARFPSLPIEEEGRLADPRLRENFIVRLFAYRRLRALFGSRWTMGGLVAFHTAHKMTLLAHDEEAYRRLGRLVATGTSLSRRDVERRYSDAFMDALRKVATRRRHANVLMHMLGHFTDALDDGSRAEMLAVIRQYAAGHVPLIVPLTLVRHHVRRFSVSYLAGQTYLDPHPAELMLLNHV